MKALTRRLTAEVPVPRWIAAFFLIGELAKFVVWLTS